MTRVVIHAGFHKTGTTSVQSTLRANRALLEPHLRVYLKADFDALTEATRAFCAAPEDDAALNAVGRYAMRFFRRIERDDPRPILMSSEDLSGHLPGRRRRPGYHAAPRIMSVIAENARHRFGDNLDLILFFSTRDSDTWLRSTWWQNLRSTRLTDDLDLYATRPEVATDLTGTVEAVAKAVAPARVMSESLDLSRDRREGPLAPLLDLFALVPEIRDALAILPPVNAQPVSGLDEVFLALNRSALSEENLRDAKKNLRRIANKQS